MTKEELKEKRKQLPRMTAQQKKEVLSFLDGDRTSIQIAKTMIENYLKVYPKELHFEKKYRVKLKEAEEKYLASRNWYVTGEELLNRANNMSPKERLELEAKYINNINQNY
jgi:hypothetical protein